MYTLPATFWALISILLQSGAWARTTAALRHKTATATAWRIGPPGMGRRFYALPSGDSPPAAREEDAARWRTPAADGRIARMKTIARLLALAAVAVLSTGARPVDEPEAVVHDLVIKGGRVLDPETGLDGVRDVAIDGGLISAVTDGQE